MIGFADAESLVQLRVEYPLFLFVQGVAGAQHLARWLVDLCGGLVGLGDLVVEAGLDVIGNRRVEGERVFYAETLAGDGVVACTAAVEVKALATDERATYRVFQVGVAIILELLVGQAQAILFTIIPAELGQYVSGARIFRVGAGAGQAGGVMVKRKRLVARLL